MLLLFCSQASIPEQKITVDYPVLPQPRKADHWLDVAVVDWLDGSSYQQKQDISFQASSNASNVITGLDVTCQKEEKK